jgi:hypothetical protein
MCLLPIHLTTNNARVILGTLTQIKQTRQTNRFCVRSDECSDVNGIFACRREICLIVHVVVGEWIGLF